MRERAVCVEVSRSSRLVGMNKCILKHRITVKLSRRGQDLNHLSPSHTETRKCMHESHQQLPTITHFFARNPGTITELYIS